MNSSAPADPVARVQTLLQGYPEATVAAAVRFASHRDAAALDLLVRGVLVFHLPARTAATVPPDPATLPGTTRLVEDLSVDSLTLVELGFLLEDVLGVRLENEALRSIVTLDDLTGLLRTRLGVPPAPPAP